VLDLDEVTLVDLEAVRCRGDNGTNDLMVSDIIRTGELQAWFLAEHLVDTPLVRV
jgi:starvation-inducible DNA-binding protein